MCILDKHFATKFYFIPILFCLFCCTFIEHLLLARPVPGSGDKVLAKICVISALAEFIVLGTETHIKQGMFQLKIAVSTMEEMNRGETGPDLV